MDFARDELELILDIADYLKVKFRASDEIAYTTERFGDVARVLSRMGHAIAIRMYGEPAGYGSMARLTKPSRISHIGRTCRSSIWSATSTTRVIAWRTS